MTVDKIITIARGYVGQSEIPPNAGFKDASFEAKMKAMGWQKGWAWCAIEAKLIWMEAAAGNPTLQAQIRHLCSPSALGTLHNYATTPGFTVSQIPVPGAIVVFKHGIDPNAYEGHEGVVVSVDPDGIHYNSVEGNTSPTDPNERNGGICAEKTHLLSLPPNPRGLNLKGFIYPPL
jgi:hypothetical protein